METKTQVYIKWMYTFLGYFCPKCIHYTHWAQEEPKVGPWSEFMGYVQTVYNIEEPLPNTASTRRGTDVVFMLVGHVEITW